MDWLVAEMGGKWGRPCRCYYDLEGGDLDIEFVNNERAIHDTEYRERLERRGRRWRRRRGIGRNEEPSEDPRADGDDDDDDDDEDEDDDSIEIFEYDYDEDEVNRMRFSWLNFRKWENTYRRRKALRVIKELHSITREGQADERKILIPEATTMLITRTIAILERETKGKRWVGREEDGKTVIGPPQ